MTNKLLAVAAVLVLACSSSTASSTAPHDAAPSDDGGVSSEAIRCATALGGGCGVRVACKEFASDLDPNAAAGAALTVDGCQAVVLPQAISCGASLPSTVTDADARACADALKAVDCTGFCGAGDVVPAACAPFFKTGLNGHCATP